MLSTLIHAQWSVNGNNVETDKNIKLINTGGYFFSITNNNNAAEPTKMFVSGNAYTRGLQIGRDDGNHPIVLTGKVGIGISTSLTSKFNVFGQDADFYSGTLENRLRMGRDVNQNFTFHVSDNHGFIDYHQDEDENGDHVLWIRNLADGTSSNNDIRFQTDGTDRITIKSNGNVGINDVTPSFMLDVNGTGRFTDNLQINNAKYIYMGSVNDRIKAESGNIGIYPNQNIYLGAVTGGQEIRHVTVFENGQVAIGSSSTGTHKLAVEGSIGAREVKVEASGWSDFVFEADYELLTLEELEQHIQEKGHLPEIPNEAEVIENGINLGEMNAKLLQKIEELTLYLIEQNKELKEAKAEIHELRSEVATLKNEY